MMKNKDMAVSTLTKGVEFLLKKNKVTYIKGHANFKSTNKISVIDNNKKERIVETERTVICTGSEPVSLPKVSFDEQKMRNVIAAISKTTGKTISPLLYKKITAGATERDLAYSGLEDTMREAFQEILSEKNKNKKLNFRTAAYAIALKKLRKFHDAVGMYS